MTIPAGPHTKLFQPPSDRVLTAAYGGDMRALRELFSWYEKIWYILGGKDGIAWDVVSKVGSNLTDIETRNHNDLQTIQELDPTSTDATKRKHLSDAQGKVWQDHVTIVDGNPHGTDHHMLDGLTDDDHAQYLLLAGRTPTQVVTTPLILGTNTDNTTVEADGTVKYNGAATVWNDMQWPLSAGKVPAANFPDWEAFTTNTAAYSFDVNDYIDLQADEVPHAWLQGSDISMHLHVALKAANATGADRFAKFEVYIAYADVGEVWTEATPLAAELTIPTGSAALHHFLLSMGTLSLPNNLIGTQIKCRIKRIAATGGTEYASHIFVTQVGGHVRCDTNGSREIATK